MRQFAIAVGLIAGSLFATGAAAQSIGDTQDWIVAKSAEHEFDRAYKQSRGFSSSASKTDIFYWNVSRPMFSNDCTMYVPHYSMSYGYSSGSLKELYRLEVAIVPTAAVRKVVREGKLGLRIQTKPEAVTSTSYSLEIKTNTNNRVTAAPYFRRADPFGICRGKTDVGDPVGHLCSFDKLKKTMWELERRSDVRKNERRASSTLLRLRSTPEDLPRRMGAAFEHLAEEAMREGCSPGGSLF